MNFVNSANDTVTQLTIAGLVLLVVVALGVFIVKKFRESAAQSGGTDGELLSNFEEMHERGEFDQAEIRKIKSVLGNNMLPPDSGKGNAPLQRPKQR